jgi:hypothetical protein
MLGHSVPSWSILNNDSRIEILTAPEQRPALERPKSASDPPMNPSRPAAAYVDRILKTALQQFLASGRDLPRCDQTLRRTPAVPNDGPRACACVRAREPRESCVARTLVAANISLARCVGGPKMPNPPKVERLSYANDTKKRAAM